MQSGLVRDHMGIPHLRQKTLYDRSSHGDPYKAGDLVWLHCPAVPRGKSPKLHCYWQVLIQWSRLLVMRSFSFNTGIPRGSVQWYILMIFDEVKMVSSGLTACVWFSGAINTQTFFFRKVLTLIVPSLV